jgi:uncharacterized protein (DUF58 family)
MGLGRPPKFLMARRIVAALGYVSLMNLDLFSVTAFADDLAAELPAMRHQSRLPRLLQFLDGLSPCGTRTNLARAAETFVRRRQRPGPLVVVSDLYDPDGFERAFEILRGHGYDPRLVQVYDAHETEPDLLGDVELFDVEAQTVRQATVTERAISRYRTLVAEFRGSVREFCRRRSMVCMQIACDMDGEEALLRALGGKRDGNPVQPSPVTSIP